MTNCILYLYAIIHHTGSKGETNKNNIYLLGRDSRVGALNNLPAGTLREIVQ